MLRAIFRKALSDVRGRPLQVTLLFLVIAAAATTLSVALTVQASAARPYERLREKANGADAWIDTAGGGADLGRLATFDSVAEVGVPYPVAYENYGIRKADRKQAIALVGLGPSLPRFDHPVVTEGRWLSPDGAGEIVVDSGAANVLGLEVGESIDLLTPQGNRPFTVVGFAATASLNPAPISEPSFAYVLPDTLYALTPGAVYGSEPGHDLRVGVRLKPGIPEQALFMEARTRLGGPFDLRTWQDVKEVSKEANQFDVIFLQVFAVFALFASGLIIANAVGGQVLSQLHDIGVLKAIGFTPGQVTATILLQNVGLSILGGIVGVLARLLVTPFFLQRTADILGVPATASLDTGVLIFTVAVIAVVVALFTLVPAWRAGRVSAVDALGTGKDGTMHVSRLAQLAARLRLPRVAVVGIKDLSRRPARTAMTVAALVLAVITATFSLGIESTFEETMSDPTVIGGPPFDIGADRDTYQDDQARAVLDAHPGVESYLPVLHTDGRIGNRGFDIWAFEGSLEEPAWAMRVGRAPSAVGEAAVSTTFAREFDVSVGQTLRLLTFEPSSPSSQLQGPDAEVPVEVTIVGTFVSTEGEIMHLLRDTYPGDAPPTDYLIKTAPGANDREVAADLIEASAGNLDPEIYSETIDDIRGQFRPVLLGLNAVLFAIAGINLLSSQLLSIRERRRDFAVLKTLGFTPGQVVASVLWGGVFLAIVSLAAGIPLGLLACRVVFDLLTSAAGIGTGVGVLPGVVWLAPLVPVVLLVTAIAGALPARMAGNLQVAEALRYE